MFGYKNIRIKYESRKKISISKKAFKHLNLELYFRLGKNVYPFIASG